MSTPEPGETLRPGTPRWGAPQRRSAAAPPVVAVDQEHVDRLVARRAERSVAAVTDRPATSTAVDDLIARREGRATAPQTDEPEREET